MGSTISLSLSFAKSLIPIKASSEDTWFNFCSIADDKSYFLNKELVKYRIHNSTTHSRNANILNWLKKQFSCIESVSDNEQATYDYGIAALEYLNKVDDGSETITDAKKIAQRIIDIGNKKNRSNA